MMKHTFEELINDLQEAHNRGLITATKPNDYEVFISFTHKVSTEARINLMNHIREKYNVKAQLLDDYRYIHVHRKE